MKLRWAALAIGSALALSACGGGRSRVDIFTSPRFDEDAEALRSLARRLDGLAPRGADVAIGVVDGGIVGVELEGGEPWAFSHPLDSRPAVSGTVVVGMGEGELFALDARTGKRLWARPASGSLRGVGDDGHTTVVSLAAKGDNATTILVVSHDGRVIRQLEAQPVVGTPAIVGPYAFFPWQSNQVSVYEITSGDEVARIELPSETSLAFTLGGSLFFGEADLHRLDDVAERRFVSVTTPPRALPGSPVWHRSGTAVLPVRADTRDKIRLHARPSASGPLAIEGRTFVGTYLQLAFGLDSETGATQWIRSMPHELLGGAAYQGGAALCDAEGTITFLDGRTGGVAGTVSLGRRIEACIVQADDFTRPRVLRESSLADELTTALTLSNPELLPMQRELLRELGGQRDEDFTKALIDIASSSVTPRALVGDVRSALAARRTGVRHMLEALARHYDFLQGEEPPPLGPLAEALAIMGESRAAPLLAEHLLDPANTSDDIELVALALVYLATERELPQLETFFALHRATADDDALVTAVAHVARAIVAVAGAAGRDFVAKGMADSTTLPAVKARIAEWFETEPQVAEEDI